jgi:hypothetical protein
MHNGQTITDLESLTERVMEFVSGGVDSDTRHEGSAPLPVAECGQGTYRHNLEASRCNSDPLTSISPDSVCPADVPKQEDEPTLDLAELDRWLINRGSNRDEY